MKIDDDSPSGVRRVFLDDAIGSGASEHADRVFTPPAAEVPFFDMVPMVRPPVDAPPAYNFFANRAIGPVWVAPPVKYDSWDQPQILPPWFLTSSR